MSGPVDVLAGLRLAARDCTAQGNQMAANELLDIKAAVGELIETQKDTLRMLEAAYRQLGMFTADNKRIQRAQNAIKLVGGAA